MFLLINEKQKSLLDLDYLLFIKSYYCINYYIYYFLFKLNRTFKILFLVIIIIATLLLIKIKPKIFVYGGWFAGECKGNCGTMYKVTEKHILKDTTTYWLYNKSDKNLKIEAQQLLENDDEGNYNNFKLNIPLIMILDPRTQFGCPDCTDQGGYYLQFTMLGMTKHFRVDKGHEPFYYKLLTHDLDTLIDKTLFEFEQSERREIK